MPKGALKVQAFCFGVLENRDNLIFNYYFNA